MYKIPEEFVNYMNFHYPILLYTEAETQLDPTLDVIPVNVDGVETFLISCPEFINDIDGMYYPTLYANHDYNAFVLLCEKHRNAFLNYFKGIFSNKAVEFYFREVYYQGKTPFNAILEVYKIGYATNRMFKN